MLGEKSTHNNSVKKIHHSDLAYFHNQKSGDLDPETGVIHEPGSKGYLLHHAIKENQATAHEIGEVSELENCISKAIEILDSVSLNKESADDQDQITLLKKKKAFAKNKIIDVMKSVSNYVASIHALDVVKQDKENCDQQTYLQNLTQADQFRKHMHNSLIKEIHSTIHFIQFNFGLIDEEQLEKWEEEQESRGVLLLDVARKQFSNNVICPETLDIHNRKQITKWAVQLSFALGKIK